MIERPEFVTYACMNPLPAPWGKQAVVSSKQLMRFRGRMYGALTGCRLDSQIASAAVSEPRATRHFKQQAENKLAAFDLCRAHRHRTAVQGQATGLVLLGDAACAPPSPPPPRARQGGDTRPCGRQTRARPGLPDRCRHLGKSPGRRWRPGWCRGCRWSWP